MEKKEKSQINFSIYTSWKKELIKIAGERSIEDLEQVTYIDLIRKSIKESYQLGRYNF